MKKNLFAVAVMVTGLISAGCAADEAAVIETTTPEGYTTENVMVWSKADEGYLNSYPMNGDSELEHGYILDDKYEIGDIVEITYSHDDLIAERIVITDEELSRGCEEGYEMAEDYSCVNSNFWN